MNESNTVVEQHKINSIELTPLHVPFKKQIQEVMSAGAGGLGMAIPAEETWTGGDYVICKLKTDTGLIGLGEVYVWLPETGISPNQIVDCVSNYLKRYVLGENPFNVDKINARMNRNVARSEIPKGLLDMACYDLIAKIKGVPLSQLWAKNIPETVPLTALIPLTSTDVMIMLAKWYTKDGFRSLRIKLGTSPEEDLKIISTIRKKVGPDIRLRVDYNQAYDVETAIKAIHVIEPFNVDVAEQPISMLDMVGMGKVQRQVKIPLMAHEMAFSLTDLETLLELGGIRVIGINSERPGGVSNALAAIKLAKDRKLGVVIHNQTLGVATAMQIHLAAAFSDQIGHASEQFGYMMLEDDLITKPLIYHRGTVQVPTTPGVGVELDEAALDKYRAGPTILINSK